MNILFTISSFRPLVGGGERQAERLAQVLATQGHNVIIATRHYDQALPKLESADGITVLRLGGSESWRYLLSLFWWILVNRRDIDLIHAHQSTTPLVVASLAALVLNIPVVCTPMAARTELTWTNGFGLKGWLFRRVNRWIAKSAEIYQILEQFAPGKVAQIPNGVDSEMFTNASQQSDSQLPTVLYIGRLERPKRLDLLLRAWSQLSPNARLVVVGDGSLRREWEDLAVELALEDVAFVGQRSDIATLLASSDLYVLPSDSEGMPNSLLEAMSCGVPCIASAVGAISEMLSDGVGFLVAPGEVAALKEALARLMESAALREEMGRRGRQRVLERYSLQSVAKRVEAVYSDTLG